ncbi:3'-5' exonuclease [Bacillus suaedae]|uniref:Exonuclease domain-containing protein n=1 Tax=Halalkalibacter suaedae TaxID=2822140 RepID=A0A940WYI6_9BACI|nr:3'-5' exonuclease [Bacillus suaedae]MBP3950841.1 exonuclease domain-containing protein [Bacillus suaedae]
MDAVIFDLELIKRFRKGQLSEIVEIGACKVNLKQMKIVDQFQQYVLPKHGHISKSTRKFIKMTEEDINNAIPFDEAIQQFADWLAEDYFLCSWGKDDRMHIIDESIRKKVDLGWFKNYNDIQKVIGAALTTEGTNQIGLKNALMLAGIEPVGKAHRGIDDAINTAYLFIKFNDKIQLQTNTLTEKDIKSYELKFKKARLKSKIQLGKQKLTTKEK